MRLRRGRRCEVDASAAWFALMYLEWWGEWQLPPLNGIASAPLLQDDGTINSTEGYDAGFGHVVRECARSHRTRSRAADEG